jgi:hypothetical protein
MSDWHMLVDLGYARHLPPWCQPSTVYAAYPARVLDHLDALTRDSGAPVHADEQLERRCLRRGAPGRSGGARSAMSMR